MQTLPSYIKDSKHIIFLLSKLKLPSNITLVTIDVSSLYTTIPQDEGTEACLKLISENRTLKSNIPIEALHILFNIVLKGNIFKFHNQIYNQLTGTAMGTKMAPSYANCFMHTLEFFSYTGQTTISLEEIYR